MKIWIITHVQEIGAMGDSDWSKLIAAPSYARAKDLGHAHHQRVRVFEIGVAHQGVSEGILLEQDYILDWTPLKGLGASRKRQ